MPADPTNAYAFAKDALRRELAFLREEHRFRFTWARLFYMYGEDQAPTSLYPQLMAAIDRKDTHFRMSGGEQLRDFLPIDEIARLIVDLATRSPGAGVVNICSGRPTSVRSLVEGWVKERGSDIALRLGEFPYPDFEPMAFWGSRTRLDALLKGAAAASECGPHRA